jgi:TatD DNase family protein
MTPRNQFFDAHCHLQDARVISPDAMLIRAAHAGVGLVCTNGTSPEDWPGVLRVAGRFPARVLPGLGLHPWFVQERPAGWGEQLAEGLRNFPAAIVGECGLDYVQADADRSQQRECLAFQFDLARELNRPIVLHACRAWGDLLSMLRDASLPAGFMVHAFGGSVETALELTALGGYLSFGAALARSSVSDALGSLPADRLLLESDAPDMLPEGAAGMPARGGGSVLNEPGTLVYTARTMARLLDLPLASVAELTTRNARRLLLQER